MFFTTCTLVLILSGTSVTNSQVPQIINYQGLLTDNDGKHVSGNHSITFLIYDVEIEGNAIWSETHNVIVQEGLFNVLLGSVKSIPYSVFAGSHVYLALKIGNDPEMTPRKRLVSVGYAFRAANADQLDGNDISQFIKAGQDNSISSNMLQDNSVNIHKIVPKIISSLNHISDDGGNIDLVSGNKIVIVPDSANKRITISTTGTGNGDEFQLPYADSTNTNSNAFAVTNLGIGPALFASSREIGIWCEGDSNGIFSSSSLGYGVRGSSAQKYGVFGTGARGVLGKHPPSNNFGYLGSSNYGVYGEAVAVGSGAVGGLHKSTGNWGYIGGEHYGIIAEAVSDDGIGVYGASQDSCGVRGTSLSSCGVYGSGARGVYGYHYSSGNYGYLGSSDYGVYGNGDPAVYGKSSDGKTFGMLGGGSSAVYGHNFQSGNAGVLGTGVEGIYGFGENGPGLFAESSNDVGIRGSSSVAGVKGESSSGYGIHGVSNSGYGVCGQRGTHGIPGYLGASGAGVFSRVDENYGYVGTSEAAIRGESANNYAIHGSSADGYAGFFEGRVFISGNVGIGYHNPNRKLYLLESTSGIAYPLKLDNPHPDYGEDGVGILFSTGGSGGGPVSDQRGKGALVYVYTNTWNRGSFHFLQDSNTGTANPELEDAVMTITYDGNVGIGTASPQGKLDVNGRIYQRGIQIHADYVFEPNYKLETIEEHATFMWKHRHLKAIPRAIVDENGNEIVEVGSHRKGIVEELEKAHIYIEQLHERIKNLESKITCLAEKRDYK